MKKYKVIGLMSGSSLDGIDLAYCEFFFDKKWHYKIITTETIAYPEEWVNHLIQMPKQTGSKLIEFDIKYGKYLGNLINKFTNKNKIKPSLISSHGHTVFHNPEQEYTFQLGNGQAIASTTGIKTICDFRIGDIQFGGQGAPLVPIGDSLLFNEYDFCINIGGIANISFNNGQKRIAFDICPANQLLNHLSRQIGKPFDFNGNIANLGKINSSLFNKLNNHPYYSLAHPKSMSNQLVTDTFINIIDESEAKLEDKLYTVCKHIAFQISKIPKIKQSTKVLITGGGTHNSFLMTAISNELQQNIKKTSSTIIDYKEALIFAFMGVLRLENKINCLASATGADKDSSTGVIYNGNN